MVALPTVLLWTSLVVALEPREPAVILEFVAENCPHSRTMEATVRRLRGDGFPVHRIDAQQDRAEAERFGIQGTPTYVLLVRDRPVERIEGAASYDRIARMFREHTANMPPTPGTGSVPPAGSAPPSFSGTPSPLAPPGLAAPVARPPAASVAPPFDNASAAPSTAFGTGDTARLPREVVERAALAATTRLRVADEGGMSVATGTVIDVRDGYALILTCGHVFRQAGTNGQIKVDLFAPGAGGPLEGRLITFDLLNDVALVSIRTDLPIRPVALAGSGYTPQPQTEVFSIGCDNGGQPRIERSRITRRNGYSGPPNLEATGAPVNGRSGGGLFALDGHLVGVCNAANEPENKGVYAAFETVHWVVTQAGLSRLIPANVAARSAPALPRPAALPGPFPAPPSPAPAAPSPAMAAGSEGAPRGVTEEYLLMVRQTGPGSAAPQYYALENVPAAVWEKALASRQPVDRARALPGDGAPPADPAGATTPEFRSDPAVPAAPVIADTRSGAGGIMPGLRPSFAAPRIEDKAPVQRGQQPRGVWPFFN